MTAIKELRIHEIPSYLRKRKYIYMSQVAVAHIGLKAHLHPDEQAT